MKKELIVFICLVFGISYVSRAQSIPIQVINSAGGGGSVGTSGVEVYYNIGETVIATNASSFAIVTQGFLQPDIIGKYGLMASLLYNGVSCVGKTDGHATITATLNSITGLVSQNSYSLSYYWSPSSVCPTNDCPTVNGLAPGTYSVLVVSSCTSAAVPIDSVKIQNIIIADNFSPCLLEIFNGVTPNGDGHNDFFYIGNIDQYPNNVVDIFNRWGQQLSHITGYNNMDKKWSGTLNGSDNVAPSGTYFYIINLNDKSSKPIKGWIELLHN